MRGLGFIDSFIKQVQIQTLASLRLGKRCEVDKLIGKS